MSLLIPLYAFAQQPSKIEPVEITPEQSIEVLLALVADLQLQLEEQSRPKVEDMSVKELIFYFAEMHGYDVSIALNIACSESRFLAHAKNPTSSAGGVFQFIDGTWASYSLIFWGEVREKYNPVHNVELAILALSKYGTRDWNASKHVWSLKPYEAGHCN